MGSTYRNEKQAKEFMHHIAEMKRNNIRLNLIITTPHRKEVSLSDSVAKGKMKSKFIGVKSVETADVSHLSNAITAIMEGSKLVALGTDGAAVMIGAKNGMVSRQKEGQTLHHQHPSP